jgi:superoxide reductase
MTTTQAARGQLYGCAACGTMLEVLRGGGCVPSCCGKEMALLTENTVDASREKHVPVIERTAAGITVRVGSVPHPMEAAHHIEWIELVADGTAYRRFLNVGEAPEATFPVTATQVVARESCNLHGLWKGEAQ